MHQQYYDDEGDDPVIDRAVDYYMMQQQVLMLPLSRTLSPLQGFFVSIFLVTNTMVVFVAQAQQKQMQQDIYERQRQEEMMRREDDLSRQVNYSPAYRAHHRCILHISSACICCWAFFLMDNFEITDFYFAPRSRRLLE